jgi:phenylalanyl-tRNA synthetase beta chain
MEIRRFLAACGLQEIMTYSLVHPEDDTRLRMLGGELIGGGVTLPLKNPISLEHSVLRRTLLIGALKTLALNLHRKSGSSFNLFELGRIYQLDLRELVPSERRRLSLLAAGTPLSTWKEKRSSRDIFHLKGVTDELLNRFGAQGVVQEVSKEVPAPYLAKPALAFRAGEKLIGWAGALHPQILSSFEIPEEIPVSYAELDMDALAERISPKARVLPLPKVPPVARDLAVLVGEEIPYSELHDAMEESGKPLLESVELFDLYKGSQVPAGKKSLAFRLLFSDGDRTLRDEEINAALAKIIERLAKQFQAAIR